MWFKNLAIYRFTQPWTESAQTIEEQLQEHVFHPCARLAPHSQGWFAPIGEDEQAPLVHETSGCQLVCLRREEKIIPSPVLREHLDEAIKKFEKQQGRKPGRNEKQRLRDEVFFTLLPQAFSQSHHHYAYIDKTLQCLIIDTPNAKKAEDFCTTLRQSLGSLKIEPLDNSHIKAKMTAWLQGEPLPENFGILDNALLDIANDENGKVRYQRHDLFSSDVNVLLTQGAQVSQLAMSWQSQLQFSLNHEYLLKQLRFLEEIKQQAQEVFVETPAQRFDTDFTIMTGSVRQLVKELLAI